MNDPTGRTQGRGFQGVRILRLVGIAILCVSAYVVAVVGVPLFRSIPRWFMRPIETGFLWTLFVGFWVGLFAAGAGLIGFSARVFHGRRRGLKRPWSARILLLSVSTLMGIGLLEGAGRIWLAGARAIRPTFNKAVRDAAKRDAGRNAQADSDLDIVVIGESSARGEPYQDWVSVGRIVEWKLHDWFPHRKIQVHVMAGSGNTLEHAIAILDDIEFVPDAVIVYGGHNEFQARYSWDRYSSHYAGERQVAFEESLFQAAKNGSVFCDRIGRLLDDRRIDVQAPLVVTRELVDHPVCSTEDYAIIRDEFHRRLESVSRDIDALGALPILIVPPSNDGGFDPNRSILPSSTTLAERVAFSEKFKAARVLEGTDDVGAEAAYRSLLRIAPGFAETHFRLARVLVRRGAWREAAEHDVSTRDLDGFPLRCPSDLRAAYAETVRRHPRAILIDGQAVFASKSEHGIVDYAFFHDGQHPNLRGYAALAEAVLAELAMRRSFGLAESVAPPRIDPVACARQFGMTPARWIEVCDRSRSFFDRTAYIRFDPTDRLAVSRRYEQAAERIATGTPAEDSGGEGLRISDTSKAP